MASFKPESEVFEITDFTNATDWENFTSGLESILYALGVGRKPEEGSVAEGTCSSHEIVLRSHTFSVSIVSTSHAAASSASPDDVQFGLGDENEDFPERSHCLAYWFGVQKFVVLSPSGDASFNVLDPSLAMQLLSSLTVAAGQSQCTVPLFVQVQRSNRRMFDGIWLSGDGLRTNFSVLTLPKVPKQYNHLSGLAELLKAELGIVSAPPPLVSIRFTYLLRTWASRSLYRGAADMCGLGVGGSGDGLASLQLSALWRNVREDMMADNAFHSSIVPGAAPWWTLRALPQQDAAPATGSSSSWQQAPQSNALAHCLTLLLPLCQRQERLNQLLGRHAFHEDEPAAELQENVRNALHRMTGEAMRAPTLSSLVQSAVVSSALEDSPLESKLLDEIMRSVFPDADGSGDGLGEQRDGETLTTHSGSESPPPQTSTIHRVLCKSCPRDSLLVRVACVLLRVYCEHGGVRPLAYVWREFVLELRHRYENNIRLADIPHSTVPDMRYGLLEQKLQMLQCCIEHKRKRDPTRHRVQGRRQRSAESERSGRSQQPAENDAGNDGWGDAELALDGLPAELDTQSTSSDGDEFFEALEEQEDTSNTEATAAVENEAETAATGASHATPEGVLSTHPDLRLLIGGAPLNVPLTQDVTPLTEDTLAEQQAMLSGLGTSDVARQLRARLQSTQLLADMEAFKAANPGCVLGDFVRWYSPRDWVLEESPAVCLASTDGGAEVAECGSEFGEWDVVSEKDLVQPEEVTPGDDAVADGEAGVADGSGAEPDDAVDSVDAKEACGADDDAADSADAKEACGANDAAADVDDAADTGGDGAELVADADEAGGADAEGTEPGGADEAGGADGECTEPDAVAGADADVAESAHSANAASAGTGAESAIGVAPEDAEANELDESCALNSSTCSADREKVESSSAEDEREQYTVPGQLSVRMRDPTTLWHQTWTSARSVPAQRQRRLFDDTLEAEKVFRFLEGMSVGQLMLYAAPIIVLHGLERVQSLPEAEYSPVRSLLKSSTESLAKVFCASLDCLPQLSDAIRYLCDAESMAVRIQSIRDALEWGHEQYSICHAAEPLRPDQLELWISDLADTNSIVMLINCERKTLPPLECSLRGLTTAQARHECQAAVVSREADRGAVESMKFTRFPSPVAREFIVRQNLPRPGPQSRPTTQRLFAALTPKEFRVATALSADMTYF